MRIAIDARPLAFVPVQRAGAYTWNSNLIKALAEIKNGNEYLLLCRRNESHLLPDFGPAFKIIPVPHYGEYLFSDQLSEQLLSSRFLNSLGIDIYLGLYFVIPLFRNYPAVSIFDDMIPWILMKKMHHLIPSTHAVGLEMKRFQYWKKLSALSSEGVLGVSESTKNDLAQMWGVSPHKIGVLYESIERDFKPFPENEKINFRKKYGLPEKFILYIATIEPRKNVVGVIKALSILRKKFANHIPLVMVGPRGIFYKEIFEKTVLEELGGMDEGLRLFSDFVPREDMPYFYNCATVFCFPSYYEGFGLTLLEAMACGLPAVTSNRSSLPEVAGKGALYADPFKPQEIADALQKILTSEELRKELSREAILQAKKFSYKKSAEDLLAFLNKVREQAGPLYKKESSSFSFESSMKNSEGSKLPSLLVLRTAPWDKIKDGVLFFKKNLGSRNASLLTQKGQTTDTNDFANVHEWLPEGLLKIQKFPSIPWGRIRKLEKNAIVIVYNNPAGYGYYLWKLAALLMAGKASVFSYYPGGRHAAVDWKDLLSIFRPLKLVFYWVVFKTLLFFKRRGKQP